MTKFCGKPFEWFEVHPNGNVSVCCYSWLPAYIGQVGKEEGVYDVFNSDVAQEVRRSILDGSFRYCNHDLCPHIQGNNLPDVKDLEGERKKIVEEGIIDGLNPNFYNLCYDESCNLSCPSCRINKILYTRGPQYKQRKIIQDRIIEDLFSTYHERECTVNITGSGDPFGSNLFRDLLFSVDGKNFPNTKINLQTNGTMFTEKYWDKMHRIHDNIDTVIISLDASSPATYSYTRRDGDWDQLQKNIPFICKLRREDKVKHIRCDFVVQHRNYKEMPDFIDMCLGYDFIDEVYFSQIVNWGTYSDEEFDEHAIHQEKHPEHQEFLDILKDDRFSLPKVCLGNVSCYGDPE